MGLIWAESFQFGAAKTRPTGTTSTVPTRTTTGRTGTEALNTGAGFTYGVSLGAADQDDFLTVGLAYKPSGANPNEDLLWFRGDTGATRHVTLLISGTYPHATISAYRGTNAGTLLGTSTSFTLVTGAWVYITTQVRLNDTTGSVVVKVDGTAVLTLTNVDTKNGGTATLFDDVQVRSTVTWADLADDLYITNEQGSTNTGDLGPVRVYLAVADGNGNSSQGLGSDGNSVDNYALVNDAFTPSTYVDLANTGDKDTYTYAALAVPTPAAGDVVAGVFVWNMAQKTDAGARSLQGVARLSGTESTTAALTLVNGTDAAVGDVFETKPGGGAWTVADVDASEFGAKAS